MGSVRKEYGSENLDRIFRYFMRTILRMRKKGPLALPVENDLEGEPLRSYLDLAMQFFTDAQPQEVARPILESQYNFILANSKLSADMAMQMWLVMELSLRVHYDDDPCDFLFRTGNLWGGLAEEYAVRTFYPNMDQAWREKHGVDQVLAHVPADFLRPEDY